MNFDMRIHTHHQKRKDLKGNFSERECALLTHTYPLTRGLSKNLDACVTPIEWHCPEVLTAVERDRGEEGEVNCFI
jgi:hypothetical protein